MEVGLTASASPLAAPRCRVPFSQLHRNPAHNSCLLFSRSHRRLYFVAHSIKLPAAEHFGEPNKVTNYLENLAVSLWDTSPRPLKEFPWEKAKTTVAARLLFVGKNALKFSFIAWFVVSFVSDVSLALTTNREMMIPLGLFIGVMLADFLKESSHELFRSSMKDEGFMRHLVGIGSFFVLVKLISPWFKMQGQALLSHIGNGGLMQVLWLAKGLRQTEDIESDKEQRVDTPASGSKD